MTPASKKKKKAAPASKAASKNTSAVTIKTAGSKQSVATNESDLIIRVRANERKASRAAAAAKKSAVSANAARQLALGAWCDDEVSNAIAKARSYAEEARIQHRCAIEMTEKTKADSAAIKNAQNLLTVKFSATKTDLSEGNAKRFAASAERSANNAKKLAPENPIGEIRD